MGAEEIFTAVALLVLAVATGSVLLFAAAVRPRAFLYLMFALLPTQFLFLPVSTFFVSPADVLVLFGGGGAALRWAEGREHTRAALRQHVWLAAVVLTYAAGFVVLGVASRTLVRVVLAVVPSVLACELLRDRRHVARAAGALVIAGVVDAAYGAFYYSRGIWLHPTRFSGMSGVNFSAIVITTAAVIALARFARTRQPVKLGVPVSLAALGLATLSKTAVLAMAVAWVFVLRRVLTPTNRFLILVPAITLIALALTVQPVRDRLFSRLERQVEADGVMRNSTDVRWMILRAAWMGFSDSPVLGVGYARFQQYSTTDNEIRTSTAGQGYGTHNTYLEILVEGGLLAFVPFLLHFAQFAGRLRIAWGRIIRERDPVVAAVVAGFLVIMLSAGFANVLLHYSFWAVTGTALACLNVLRWERAGTQKAVSA